MVHQDFRTLPTIMHMRHVLVFGHRDTWVHHVMEVKVCRIDLAYMDIRRDNKLCKEDITHGRTMKSINRNV